MTGVPGEIDTLERYVQQRLHNLEISPHLPENKARPFLEEIAFRRLSNTTFPDAVKAAAANLRLDWPPASDGVEPDTAVAHVFDGIVVIDNETAGFVTEAIEDYLAACHIVHRQPGRPRWWQPLAPKYLTPHTEWPWQEHKVALFVVAMWWESTESAVRRGLNTLLSKRNSDPNVHFVAELLRRGLVQADDLREKTVETLRQHLADGERSVDAFTATEAALYAFDPELAMVDLEHLVQFPNPSINDHRRLAAVDVLATRDSARGANNLGILATTLSDPPRERLDVIILIRDRDQALGDKAVRQFANDPDMGDLRVEAEILTGDHTSWADKVAGDRTWPDTARLRLLAELVKHDSAKAVAATEQFARTVAKPSTEVRIARLIWQADEDVALRIAHDVAWPTRRRVPDTVRRSAVDLIGEIDPGRTISELERFSRDKTVGMEFRFHAAMDIVEQGGQITVLREFADDKDHDLSYRVKAARRISLVSRDVGGHLFIALAKDRSPTDWDQLTFLQEAREFVPGAAAEELTEVAKDDRRPAQIRIKAVDIARLAKRESIKLYTLIATSTRDREGAFQAADKVIGLNLDAGQRLMAQLAKRFATVPEVQLRAALRADRYGKPFLTSLADRAPSDQDRLSAAQALYKMDQRAGETPLQKLVRKRGADDIRIQAALSLAMPLPALISIVESRGDETVRFRAGMEAARINPVLGRRALAELAADPAVPPRTREAIRRYLNS
jgi:hypothetical protein